MLRILHTIKLISINSRYITYQKLKNYFRLRTSYLLSFTKKITGNKLSPAFISIEATNFCNLHCPECPVGTNCVPSKEKKTFDIDLLQNTINQLESTLIHVILYFQGEPFLHPQLTRLISIIHSKKIYCSTSTNGQFLNKNKAEAIVLSGLDKLIVSIDGTTQETYERYRIGGSLEKALQGIKNLIECKKELNSASPIIELQFLVLSSNEHQMHEMKALAKNLEVDRLSFKTAQLNDFEYGNELMPKVSKYSRYKKNKNGQFSLKKRQKNHCWRLWSGAVIDVNGEVLPCCFDKNSAYSFGNVYKNSFFEIWHNKKASGFRKSILQNRKQYEMCRNCTN